MQCARRLGLAILAVVGLVVVGCQPEPSTKDSASKPDDPVWFRDDTAAAGLDFHHDPGPIGNYFMPQIVGSGAGLLLDYKGDNDFYLYLLHDGGPKGARNRFYHWHSGRFEDVSAGSGLNVAGYGMGVAVGDVDNDGHPDIYVAQYGGGRLFHNRGNNTFEDVTKQAGVELLNWGSSCCFVDYDRDGWLDLVVVNYLDYDPMHTCGPASGKRDYCHPNTFFGLALRLFHNRGRDKSGHWLGFEDVTRKAGVEKPMPGLGVVCADFNGDGWPDILTANDAKANCLWINRHDGTFVDEAVARGIGLNAMGEPQSNMGVTVADVTGNGRLDVFITHLTEETHTLWRQTGPGMFEDYTVRAGLASPHWRGTGFGTILADFDLDGAPDIAVANGRVARARGPAPKVPGMDPYWAEYAERNQLFHNDGHGRFQDVSRGNQAFCGTPAVSRGLVWGDIDGDGRVDLITTEIAGPAHFYRNVTSSANHWLIVRAVDPALHRDAYGAVVTVRTGTRHRMGLINPGQGCLCSGDPRAHFGLGQVSRVDDIRVDWPDGSSEVFPGTTADRTIRLERGKGQKVRP